MTVSVPAELVFSDQGDGSTTVFAYPVRFLEASELVVISREDGVDTVLTLNTDYTVSGAGAADGGSVTMLYVPTADEAIIRYRETAAKQIVNLTDSARNPAEAVEQQLDRLAKVDQDQAGGLRRAWKAPVGTNGGMIFAGTQGKFAVFNGDGDIVPGSDPGAGDSGFDVFQAETAADIRALLDLEPGTDVQAQSAILQSLADETLTAGDLLYAADAGTIANLPIGTDGQVLGVNAGALAWQTAGTGDMLESVYDPRAKAGDPFPYDTVADFEAESVAAEINTVDIRGYSAVGDEGGGRYKRVGSEPAYGGRQSADGAWWELIPENGTVSVLSFGADRTYTNESTAAINEAIEYSLDKGCKVFIPSGRYIFNGYTCTRTEIALNIEGDAVDLPLLRATQADIDAENYMFFLCSTRYSNVEGLAIASDLVPGLTEIPMVDVTGLEPGMIMQISSDQLWHNGNRGTYYRGELHKVVAVDAVTNIVTISDFVRDVYETTHSLTIRAWRPNRLSFKNARVEAPLPTNQDGSITSVGLFLQQFEDPIIENVHFKEFPGLAIADTLCWNSRYTNIHVAMENGLDAEAEANGYGGRSNGSVGTIVDGLYARGLRRAWDFGSISGVALSAVCRDWRVQNSTVDGGSSWWPRTDAINYGIGGHGSYENGVIQDCYIRSTRNGITARGRNTIVDGVTFEGAMDECVSLHEEAAGLIVRNCVYDSLNYPNKLASLTDAYAKSGCNIFVRLGLDSGTASDCKYDLPIILNNNVAKGLKEAFVHIGRNLQVIRNIRATDNYVEATPGDGNTFTAFAANEVNTNWSDGFLDSNEFVAINGSITEFDANLRLGWVDAGVATFKIDGVWHARIGADTVARIPRAAKAGNRILVAVAADAGGQAYFRLIPENASIASMGSLPATFKATATGSALTGTTGAVGDVTFGLMNNGDLYIESRSAGTYTFRLHIV